MKISSFMPHRKFLETVELQIALKNYDPARDKRFTGTVKLTHVPKVSPLNLPSPVLLLLFNGLTLSLVNFYLSFNCASLSPKILSILPDHDHLSNHLVFRKVSRFVSLETSDIWMRLKILGMSAR
jgi:hypothetical protein